MMDEVDLTLAIRNLRPNSQFSFTGTDYSTIKWDVLEGDAPTQAQIDASIKQVKANQIAAEAQKATEKAALLNKLGISELEAKLLLS
jgi:hypothetical protein